MTFQAIAFDLDGTLLNSQGQILTSSQRAIQNAREKGIKIILVTGRHHTAARPYHYQLGLDTPIICCNGTYIYDVETDSMPIANPLSKTQAAQVIEVAEKYGTHLLMYSRDAMNYLQLNDHMRKFSQWVASCPESVRPHLQQVQDFRQLLGKDNEVIWKFVVSHPDRAVMEQTVAALPAADFSCEWSWIDRVDIAKNGNSKGRRLLELLNTWKIDPRNVIAFGDNHNDISMLTSAGLGIAMGNAEPAVKQQATLVTLSNDEDGIAAALAEHL